MATLIEFETGATPVVIDVTPAGGGLHAAGALEPVVKKVGSSFEDALKMAAAVARTFQRVVVEEGGVPRAELELGFQFTGKGQIFVVQSEVQAALKVRITCEKKSGPGA